MIASIDYGRIAGQVGIMEIKKLSFAADSPPLSVIAAAKVAGISFPADASGSAPTFHFSNGYVFLPF